MSLTVHPFSASRGLLLVHLAYQQENATSSIGKATGKLKIYLGEQNRKRSRLRPTEIPSEKLASDDDISDSVSSDEYPVSEGNTPIVSEFVARRLNFKRMFALLPALLVLVMSSMFGQTSTGQSGAAETKAPTFDIVSIKPNQSGRGGFDVESNDSNYTAINISLKMLFEEAYGIKEDQVYGLPGWASSARFDIEAKIVEPNPEVLKKLTPEQHKAMFQALLADRFQLKVHTETRVLPVLKLVAVKGGPKFKEFAPEGSPEDKSPNGIGRGGISAKSGVLTAHAIPLTSLANTLAHWLHQTVIDKTGLTGQYDLILKWAPEYGPDASSESSRTSLFTALQEQLGLKLRSSKGPVETLVIDHVEMPSEN